MKVRLPNALGGLQEKMQKAQENLEFLESKEYVGSSGGEIVTVKVLGNLTATSVQIKDEAFEDKEMLEDLILTAFNNAIKSAINEKNEISSSLTSGLNLPAGLKFPGLV